MKALCVLSVFATIIYTVNCVGLPSVCPEIVTKSGWDGRQPISEDYVIIPVKYIVIHHTVTPECGNVTTCSSILKSVQNFHMEDMEFHDIGYNFLIGGDGRVYEGASWHKIGAHTFGYNTKSLGIAFIGDFSDTLPTSKALKALKDFLLCGIEMGEIHPNYKIFAARQVSATKSPGLRLYKEIQKLEHFDPKPTRM
ncbi:peptidoglycan-recognition protein 2-like isoform X2 [Aethina tumida]|uniref:peptidoglycan-recognition protein 2-like isoform X2 n=1 Tax=Aethina tumida TaxID=116153 RepID=UPI002147EE5A|nr:peptidoglycan-recognition protein 2-like isoform X2 [Aethina tumida]